MQEHPLSANRILLLVSVFIVATCGLIYELVAGTLASYLLGDSVTQFSTIIGVYLFSMGVGSFFSKYLKGNLLLWFIRIELIVGLVGGFSAALLFWLFPQVEAFQPVLYLLVFVTGMLVGLEIPLLMRILEKRVEFKELVAQVFSFDYVGALLASVIFPLILIPKLGLIRTSLLFGLLNTGIAIWLAVVFKRSLSGSIKSLLSTIVLCAVLLGTGFVFADSIQSLSEQSAYGERILFSKSSPYQRIIITRDNHRFRLFLNGNLQFSSDDEYRYHEALVHPVLSSFTNPINVVVLGGGDGLAIREILKYPNVSSITLVDLDPAMVDLFRSNELLTALNKGAFSNPKVKVIHSDAFRWLRQTDKKFDVAIVDFPDPSNFSVGKLYTETFYRELWLHLTTNGKAVIQSTSPYVAPKAFWCVDKTLRASGFFTFPYHAYVPSFGEWGYVMASKQAMEHRIQKLPSGLKFFNATAWQSMLQFPPDMQQVETEVNRLNNQSLVHYFENEWSKVQ